MLSGEDLAWSGTSTGCVGKDTRQMEAFNQGEQEIRDGLLHWVAGPMWGKGTDDRVDEFRVGDIFICAVPAGL